MRGVNVPYSWYKGDLGSVLPAVAKTGANVIRAVLGDGGKYERDDAASVKRLLDQCKASKLVAVLEVHDETGSNDVRDLKRAADYWVSIAPVLKGLENRVIINIANEWSTWGVVDTWSLGYRTVIPTIRKAGLKHLLMVDAAGWGQDVSSLSLRGQAVVKADPLRNTMFGLHMYEVNGADGRTVQRTLNAALAVGVPFAVTEFSDSQLKKPVAYKNILAICQQRQIGWIAWSWYGNGPGTTNMDMVASAKSERLTPIGNELVNGLNGIRRTSRIPRIW